MPALRLQAIGIQKFSIGDWGFYLRPLDLLRRVLIRLRPWNLQRAFTHLKPEIQRDKLPQYSPSPAIVLHTKFEHCKPALHGNLSSQSCPFLLLVLFMHIPMTHSRPGPHCKIDEHGSPSPTILRHKPFEQIRFAAQGRC